jgi:transposase
MVDIPQFPEVVEKLRQNHPELATYLGAQAAKLGAQAAQVGALEQENASLRAMLAQQRRELEALLRKYVLRKQVELPDVDQQVFAELLDQLGAAVQEREVALADLEARAAEPPPPPAGKKRYRQPHPGRQILPAHFERRVTVLDLPEPDRVDPITKQEYPVIERKRSERVECIPAQYYVAVIERVTRAIPGKRRRGVETPELPPHVLPKALVGTSFLAEMLVKRFVDHLPFDRQAKALQRQGLGFHRNDLDGWYLQLGAEALVGLHEAHVRAVLATDYVCFDDTPVKLQVPGEDGKLHEARIWICRAGPGTGPPLVFFRYTFDKSSGQAKALLGNFKGFAQADAAGIHDAVMLNDQVTEVGCWAHATRRFKDADAAHPRQVEPVLKLLRQLYGVRQTKWVSRRRWAGVAWVHGDAAGQVAPVRSGDSRTRAAGGRRGRRGWRLRAEVASSPGAGRGVYPAGGWAGGRGCP